MYKFKYAEKLLDIVPSATDSEIEVTSNFISGRVLNIYPLAS